MSAEGQTAAHESAARLLWRWMVMLGLISAGAWLLAAWFREREIALGPLVEFGPIGLPFGLVQESDLALASGERVVRFVRSGEGGLEPCEATFLAFSGRKRVQELLKAPEENGGESMEARLAEWEREKGFEWQALLKRGELAWGSYRSKLVVLRDFRQGGGWSDEARIDLSTSERPLALSVRWNDEVPYDEGGLYAILGALELPQAP
jgi:hypothetical protein